MHLISVRSAAQARVNLFGRQSPPLQYRTGAAHPIPAKTSDSIALRRYYAELIGSMFAGGQKLRRWRLVKNHFAEGYPFKAHSNPRCLVRQYCCVRVGAGNRSEVVPFIFLLLACT